MPRVTIQQPERYGFSTDIQIYQSHINEGGHLDNAALLTLVSEARERFFKRLGYTQIQVEDVGIIVADAALRYLSEAFHGEILSFAMTAADFNKYGCDLVWRATEKDTGRPVAEGKTGILFFDYAARKVAGVPQPFRDKVEALAG